jgi:hypothetical protein
LHEHTHSYIHEAFHRAARWLGLDAVWLPDEPIDPGALAGSLVLTEGQVDRCLPVRDDCFYVVHNWDPSRPSYELVRRRGNYLALQVLIDDVVASEAKPVNGFACAYLDERERVLYTPWATDLLPDEIDRQRKRLPRLLGRRDGVAWVGTIGAGAFGNAEEVTPFVREAQLLGLTFTHRVAISRREHVRTIERALLAPAIVGAWQLGKGYIPCRIFKNASYGHIGVTNSRAVRDLFGDELCLWNVDTAALCREAYAWNTTLPARSRTATIGELMGEVAAKHTFVARLKLLLDVIGNL